jgi:hypothetical protein
LITSPLRRGTSRFRFRPLGLDYHVDSLSLTLPALTGEAFTGSSASVELPALEIESESLELGSSIAAPLPAFVISSAFDGAQASGELPALSASGSISAPIYADSISITLPALRVEYNRLAGDLPALAIVASASLVESLTKQAWVTNLALGETTRFLNFDFLHIIRLGGTLYGVKSDGLYALGSATDAGSNIAGHIKTHPHDFGAFHLKRIPYLYVGSDNTVVVTPAVDGTNVAAYTSDVGAQRTRLNRGSKGRYWAFKIANSSGGALKIDGIEPLVEVLSRKA